MLICDSVGFGDISRQNERVRDVNRSDQQLLSLREGLVRGRSFTVYGMTRGTGRKLADMEPFHGTASRFLQEVLLEPANLRSPHSHVRLAPSDESVYVDAPCLRLSVSPLVRKDNNSYAFCALSEHIPPLSSLKHATTVSQVHMCNKRQAGACCLLLQVYISSHEKQFICSH